MLYVYSLLCTQLQHMYVHINDILYRITDLFKYIHNILTKAEAIMLVNLTTVIM